MNGVEIWSQINESVKVLAWPAVVSMALWTFRVKLGTLFTRLREADTVAGKMKFDPAVAERAIELDAANLVAGVAGAIAVGTGGYAGSRVDPEPAADTDDEDDEDDEYDEDSEDSEDEGDEEDERARRRARWDEEDDQDVEEEVRRPVDLSAIREDVEALIQSSFSAGFVEASRHPNTKFADDRPPRPVIEWQGAEPRIVDWEATGIDEVSPQSKSAYRNAIERRLRQISLPGEPRILTALEEATALKIARDRARDLGDIETALRLESEINDRIDWIRANRGGQDRRVQADSDASYNSGQAKVKPPDQRAGEGRSS